MFVSDDLSHSEEGGAGRVIADRGWSRSREYKSSVANEHSDLITNKLTTVIPILRINKYIFSGGSI